MIKKDAALRFPWLLVAKEYSGQRIDNYLLSHLKNLPRTQIYALLRSGEVRVNSKRAKPSDRLVGGESLRVPYHLIEPVAVNRAPPDRLIHLLQRAVLFEDETLLVLNKPSGIAVHGGSGLSFGVIEVVRLGFPKASKYELVHRLDKETSGCLLIAKNRTCLSLLQNEFRQGRVDKTYWALLAGKCPKTHTVTAPLKKNILQSGERMVRVDLKSGKASTTHFSCLNYFKAADLSWVEAKPESGRTHQIRVHAAFMGCGILCDSKYGDKTRASHDKRLGLKRLALHARALGITHQNQPVQFIAPWEDSEFQPFLTRE